MKKRFVIVLVLCLLTALMLPLTAAAAGASASLTGPETVRAGDTIKLTFNLIGNDMEGAEGTLEYDQSQLELVGGPKQIVAAPWKVEYNGNKMIAYDDNLSAPLSGTKSLFSLTFKVKDLAAGTNITVSYTGVNITDSKFQEDRIGKVSYTATVAQPLGTNNLLASLTASNAKLTPAFSANVTNYTAEVPFSVSKLDIKATAADGKAKVQIYSPNLTPGGVTNASVTVTAENGSKKTYVIAVTRAKDPNYVASGENSLSAIQVEGFLLSPVFDGEKTEYVVWLPYETESVTVTATPKDTKASVKVEGGEALIAGQDNAVKVICTAENGTEKVYTVIVKRAAEHGAVPTVPTEPEPTQPEPTEPSTTVTEPESTQPSRPAEPQNPSTPADGIAKGWVLVIAILCLAGGLGAGLIIRFKKY